MARNSLWGLHTTACLTVCLPTYLPLPTYPPTYLFLPTYLYLPPYLPPYLYLPAYLPTSTYPPTAYLPTYLLLPTPTCSTHLPTNLPTYLPTYTLLPTSSGARISNMQHRTQNVLLQNIRKSRATHLTHCMFAAFFTRAEEQDITSGRGGRKTVSRSRSREGRSCSSSPPPCSSLCVLRSAVECIMLRQQQPVGLCSSSSRGLS